MLFYRGLAELGCWITSSTTDGKQHFTPEQARNHMLKIGGEANEVIVDRAVASKERGPIRHELDEPITDQECATEINKMKISAGGDDEVNKLMIRQAAPEVREEVYNIIQKMFVGETSWDPVTTRAVVVL